MGATLLGAAFLRNPPTMPGGAAGGDYPDFRVSENGTVPFAPAGPAVATSILLDDLRQLCCRRFAAIWTIFFCNIVAGISIISFQSPIFQDLCQARNSTLSAETLAAYGGWLIAITAVFNGLGRMFWGGLSDRIGRVPAFRVMLGSQAVVFAALPLVGDPWLFGVLICYVLLCYGGGFGTMPSLIQDVFGARRMAAAYGLVLTAWSAGGIVGPQIIAAFKDCCPAHAATYSFLTSVVFLAIGLILSLLLRGERAEEAS
jgi:MFS transporter, OFA family, oxalate/formate antiporter